MMMRLKQEFKSKYPELNWMNPKIELT